MSRHAGEKNPEIRHEAELPLFEQNFYQFEQKHSALPEVEKAPEVRQSLNSRKDYKSVANGSDEANSGQRRIAAQSQGEQPSQDATGERSKEKAMLSGRFSEASPTSATDSCREGSREINRPVLSLEVPMSAARGEGSRPLSFEQFESGRTETLPGAGERGAVRQNPASALDRVAAPDKAHARRSDPGTSKAAAKKVTNLGRTRDAIRKILELYGPSTDEHIRVMYIGMLERGEDIPFASPSGLRSRRKELVDWLIVEDSGELGETELGNSAIKWRLK